MWLNPEDIILSEISQSQKEKYCRIPLIWGSRIATVIETESRMGGARGGRKQEGGAILQWGQSFSLEDEKVLETDGGNGCTTMWMYSIHQTVRSKMVKMVNFMYISSQKKLLGKKKDHRNHSNRKSNKTLICTKHRTWIGNSQKRKYS